MSAADIQYAPQTDVPSKRIHILGTGSIGKLVAHALRGIHDPPPVTLLLHRAQLLSAWNSGKKVITVQDGDDVIARGGFDVEFSPPFRRQYGVVVEDGSPDVWAMADQTGMKPYEVAKMIHQQRKEAGGESSPASGSRSVDTSDPNYRKRSGDEAISNEPIYNLIVTTKTPRTIAALLSIKHRITKETTICFLQNGMGMVEEANKEVFPDESTRPSYVQGIISHGANVPLSKAEEDPFFVVHAGHGTVQLGAIPRRTTGWREDATPSGFGTENAGRLSETQLDNEVSPTGRYIIRTLTRTPILAAVAFTPIELLQLQLEKLAINSVLNPMTALLDNRNGTVLYNFALSRVMRLLLAETSLVIRSLPELRGLPNVPHRFASDRLEGLVVAVANKTRDNISSMLADVRRGAPTEVEYINGYIVKRGEELGIKPVVNYSFMQMVIGKQFMVKRETDDEVPQITDHNRE
ncbi:putative 2-dehydropantoate 2-reductase [Pseudocercospora fuligena]|uniref:2-dehydropantoate 2-reductase n=1 Tax=Pseudocercospora fuligena TaxID=685502 RepID=A0A8H6RKB1_9PEZI|nr:putative 2-dehydropantoate 2-reductase [Pseudocercospora fuligena]KAF7192428.1 putative 2-dehydropantoate 2-reductase [Pseudocercospora fuligena]